MLCSVCRRRNTLCSLVWIKDGNSRFPAFSSGIKSPLVPVFPLTPPYTIPYMRLRTLTVMLSSDVFQIPGGFPFRLVYPRPRPRLTDCFLFSAHWPRVTVVIPPPRTHRSTLSHATSVLHTFPCPFFFNLFLPLTRMRVGYGDRISEVGASGGRPAQVHPRSVRPSLGARLSPARGGSVRVLFV